MTARRCALAACGSSRSSSSSTARGVAAALASGTPSQAPHRATRFPHEPFLRMRSRRSYLQQQLVPFASSNPQIKFTVGRWPNRHPFVIGRYLADGEKVLSLKNLSPLQVASRVQFLRDSRPVPLRKWQKQLRSSPSIQGSWQMGRELPAHKVIRAPSAL